VRAWPSSRWIRRPARRALTTRPSRAGNGRSARTAMKVESRDALLTAIARGWIDDIRCASPYGNLRFERRRSDPALLRSCRLRTPSRRIVAVGSATYDNHWRSRASWGGGQRGEPSWSARIASAGEGIVMAIAPTLQKSLALMSSTIVFHTRRRCRRCPPPGPAMFRLIFGPKASCSVPGTAVFSLCCRPHIASGRPT
jgi:hypothetical protein